VKNLRLFFAVNFTEKEKGVFQKLIEAHQDLPLRWVDPKNIHLTVLFIGYVPEERLPQIIDSCSQTFKKHRPFEIIFNEIDWGPLPARPRLIWIRGEPDKNQTLSKLHRDLTRTMDEAGVQIRNLKISNRGVTPHITLGRIKMREFRSLPEKPAIKAPIRLVISAKSVELMESRLSGRGADYSILQSWLL
jgi:2'-5' RNA ligase